MDVAVHPVMLDITTHLASVHGGAAKKQQQPVPGPVSQGMVVPNGGTEARGLACLAAPTGKDLPYKQGDWICRETGQSQPLPTQPAQQ
jgi:hypothetical protein